MTNLITLAERGNAEAQYELSVRYFYGDGVPQDYAKAIIWIQEAAAKGLVDAQYDLAVCYENGNIVEQNYYIAVDWYKKAASNGHLGAMTNLALLYCLGRGCNQDYSLALAWWEKAANLGDANAIYNLGISYAEGKIVDKDLSKAAELFLQAEELGCEQASSALANMDDEDFYEESEFTTNEFTYSIDIARKIYQKLKTQEDANNEFYMRLEDFFIKKGKGFKEEDGNGVIGFEEIVYKNDEQTISVLVQFGNKPSVYAIILPTYGAYTRQLFNEGLSNKHIFGLPIFRMEWFDDLDKAFIYFIDRESYLNYDTPLGRMEKELLDF